MSVLLDALGRPLRDVRISVTDRCNLRCTYCMPKEVFGPDYPFAHAHELLSRAEILRLAGVFVQLGVRKIRITGGEPLLRSDIVELIGELFQQYPQLDISLTTNGLRLATLASALQANGLKRITVSLDSLDPQICGQINGLGVGPQAVLTGIEAALAVGLQVKVNTVIQRGLNDLHLNQMLHTLHQRYQGQLVVRCIEYMDVGNSNGWHQGAVVSSARLRQQLQLEASVEPLGRKHASDVATRYQYTPQGSSFSSEIGFISSVSEPFCGECSRARISADGQLYTCLFASQGFDIRALLRQGATDQQIVQSISEIWQQRQDRYSEERSDNHSHSGAKVEMSRMGG